MGAKNVTGMLVKVALIIARMVLLSERKLEKFHLHVLKGCHPYTKKKRKLAP